MNTDERLPDLEYLGLNPFNDKEELQINPEYARFILPREKKRKKYQAQYDANWNEVVSFEVCEVHYCKDDKTWPLNVEIPKDFDPIGTAGMLFLFSMPYGRAVFPVWTTFPIEDVSTVRELLETQLEQPSLPGLAHYGTAAAVRYIADHCEVLSRHRAQWYDWSKRGRQAKPNPKFRERGPDYVFCKEGMAIDLYGAGEQLAQMSTFWPWRLVKTIFNDIHEFSIKYQWHEDAYTYQQQVLDDEERRRISEDAQRALDVYNSSDDVQEILLIRPRSFPSRFHKTWEKLEAFSSKASRNQFPPIYDFVEEIDDDDAVDDSGVGLQ